MIGFNGLFDTLNLGAAQTQGIETELRATPIADLILTASYTYLDTEKTSSRTSLSRKARVCRAGREMKFTFQARISGGRNSGQRSKRNSLTRGRN